MTAEERQRQVQAWPEWMREAYRARVEELLSCGWLHRAQCEALAYHGVLAQAQGQALPAADSVRVAA